VFKTGSWPAKMGLTDALSITLFNIMLEKVMRNTETHPNGMIFNRTTPYTAYANVLNMIDDND
jgi:hypothetical protein